MIRKIKALVFTDLIKITSWTGIATVTKIGSQFVISKVLAVFIGPPGLAMMGQLTNVVNVFQAVGSGGITVGVTKYVAEYADDKKEQEHIIINSFKVVFYLSLICTIVLVLFHKSFAHLVFGGDQYNLIILALGFSLILLSFNTLFISIINGLKQYKKYIIINIVSSIVNLALTIVFVKLWGVTGALLTFILSPALIFFVSFFLLYKNPWLSLKFISQKFNNSALKKLGNFSLMAINNAIVGSLAQLAVRSIITHNISLDMAGIWDGMNRLSSAYLLLLTTSIQVYYLPTLSSIAKPALLWEEIIKTEKIIIPAVFILFIFIFLFRNMIIDLLFTSQFTAMKELLILQLIGDIIKISAWILAYTMYAKAMTKQLILTDNIFTLLSITFTYFLIEKLGLKAVYYGYILNNTIYLIVIYFYLKSYFLKRVSDV